MPDTLALSCADAAAISRIAKTFASAASHRAKAADPILRYAALTRDGDDLVVSMTDRFVAMRLSLTLADPAWFDALPGAGLLINTADLAKLLAVTAAKSKDETPGVWIGVEAPAAAREPFTLVRSDKDVQVEAHLIGDHYPMRATNSILDSTGRDEIAVDAMISGENLRLVAGMLPPRTGVPMKSSPLLNGRSFDWHWNEPYGSARAHLVVAGLREMG